MTMTPEEIGDRTNPLTLLRTAISAMVAATAMGTNAANALASIGRSWLEHPELMPGPNVPPLADLRDTFINLSPDVR